MTLRSEAENQQGLQYCNPLLSCTEAKHPENPLLSGEDPVRVFPLEILSADQLVTRAREDLSNRELKLLFRKESAQDFVGTLEPGIHVFGFSKGQFSLVDVLEAIMGQLGRADVSLSSWTVADVDLSRMEELLTTRRITRLRLLLDTTFLRRQPALFQHVRERFGSKSIRVTKNHAKFMLIGTPEYKIVVRTSMNLNFNARLEDVEIKDDPQIYAFLDGILDRVFGALDPEIQPTQRPADATRDFDRL